MDLLRAQVLTGVQVPHPESIAQSDPQRVVYTDSVYVLAAYPVTKQTTKVVLASNVIESYSHVDPVRLMDDKITYGPYKVRVRVLRTRAVPLSCMCRVSPA